jgi:hypothetical protein
MAEADDAQDTTPSIDGKSAAAVLMMLLAEEEAAAIVGHLDANEVKALGSAMLGVAGISEDNVDAALEMFANKCRGVNPLAADPTPRVRSVIEQALGPSRAGTLLADIAPVSSPKLAEMLDWMEVDVLAALLDNEHPQVGALIVSSLSADLAAQALGKLEEGRQTDLLLRAARLGRVSVEAITELVRLHLRFHTYEMGWTDSAVRRYVNDAGPLLTELNVLTRCDCTTRNERKAARLARRMDELEERITELATKEELKAIRPELDGVEVMKQLDVPAGPIVGRALKFLLEIRLEEGLIGDEEIRRRLDAWWATQPKSS